MLNRLPRPDSAAISFLVSPDVSILPSDAFSSDSDSNSAFTGSDVSTSSSLASSPALPPFPYFSSVPDLYLSDPRPTALQLASYASSIIRNEAYALLALAARLAPAAEPVIDEEVFTSDTDRSIADNQVLESKTNESFRQALEGLSSLPPHGKILVTGVGKSGIVAQKMVATFNSLGIPSVFLHPLEALHGDLGVICPCSPSAACDALMLVSHSGATAELMRLLPIVRTRLRMLVAVTRDPESVLARACGNWLDSGTGAYFGAVKDGEKVTDEADSALPAPTSSVVAALAIGDAVALSLNRIRLGWEKDGKARRQDFLRCHPGGQLGIALGRETRGVLEGSTPSSPPCTR